MTRHRLATAAAVIAGLVAAGCGGGSDEPAFCRPSGEGIIDLTEVVGVFGSIADDAARAGLASEDEFAAFMIGQIPPAIEGLESAEANFAEAAEAAEGDDIADDLAALSEALAASADELRTDPAAALGSSDLNSLLASTSNQLQERCGETLAELATVEGDG
jgi:hypothetical protein